MGPIYLLNSEELNNVHKDKEIQEDIKKLKRKKARKQNCDDGESNSHQNPKNTFGSVR
jgi:hypothetical protein